MQGPPREALSLAERGWQGSRECALALDARGIAVTQVVKGWVSRDVQQLITPRPHVTWRAVPRRIFWAIMWLELVGRTATGRLRWVLVDHERRVRELAGWCRSFRIVLVFVQETPAGTKLVVDGRPASWEIFA